MKNKLFALTLLSSFAYMQAHAPLSPEERTKLLKEEIKNEIFCSEILFGLYQIANKDSLTPEVLEKLQKLEPKLRELSDNFKCSNHQDLKFKNFAIEQQMYASDKKEADLSIEELDAKENIEQEFMKISTHGKYRFFKLAKQLGLTPDELHKLGSKYAQEFREFIGDPKN